MESRKRGEKSDTENPEWTAGDFAQARSGSEVFADLGMPVPARRGRPPSDSVKRQVTLRLDAEVVEHFKAGGPGWQTRINQALLEALSVKKAG